jgi:hypothetical protein
MKKAIILAVAALMIFGLAPQQANAQGAGSSINNTNINPFLQIALDSAITNASTDSSAIFSMDTWKTDPLNGHNYFESSKVIVTCRQTNDSVSAKVYVEVGNISTTGAVPGRSYSQPIYVDSLYKGHEAIAIDMSTYKMFPQAQIKVTGMAGAGYLAKWSAFFGGIGILPIPSAPAPHLPGSHLQ